MWKRVLALLVVVSCMLWPGVAVAQERAPHAGSTAVGIDAGVFIPSADQLDNALIVNALLGIRHAAGQSPHQLRPDRSRLLAGISRLAAPDSAATGRQLQLGERQVASIRRRWCGRVLPAVQG